MKAGYSLHSGWIDSGEGIWKPLSESIYFRHSGKTGSLMAVVGPFVALHNAVGFVFTTLEPLFLLLAALIFLHSGSLCLARLCGIPDPPPYLAVLPLGHEGRLIRPSMQVPELLHARLRGFRNANKESIQPRACAVRESQAKLQGQVPYTKRLPQPGVPLVWLP